MRSLAKINEDSRLYVMNEGGGFSCLGFDVLEERLRGYVDHLRDHGQAVPFDVPAAVGTPERFDQYRATVDQIRAYYDATKTRCESDLSPQLKGLEGWRVEVETDYGEKRRFIVGRSTGWIPIHLEIARRNSSGGSGAERRYSRVMRLEQVR